MLSGGSGYLHDLHNGTAHCFCGHRANVHRHPQPERACGGQRSPQALITPLVFWQQGWCWCVAGLLWLCMLQLHTVKAGCGCLLSPTHHCCQMIVRGFRFTDPPPSDDCQRSEALDSLTPTPPHQMIVRGFRFTAPPPHQMIVRGFRFTAPPPPIRWLSEALDSLPPTPPSDDCQRL